MSVNQSIVDILAPTRVLRAAINLANFLLVLGTCADGKPGGVSPSKTENGPPRSGPALPQHKNRFLVHIISDMTPIDFEAQHGPWNADLLSRACHHSFV